MMNKPFAFDRDRRKNPIFRIGFSGFKFSPLSYSHSPVYTITRLWSQSHPLASSPLVHLIGTLSSTFSYILNSCTAGETQLKQGTIFARFLPPHSLLRWSGYWFDRSMAASSNGRSLEQTPTWAVAVVCFVLVLISIIIEHIIHLIGQVCGCSQSFPRSSFSSRFSCMDFICFCFCLSRKHESLFLL